MLGRRALSRNVSLAAASAIAVAAIAVGAVACSDDSSSSTACNPSCGAGMVCRNRVCYPDVDSQVGQLDTGAIKDTGGTVADTTSPPADTGTKTDTTSPADSSTTFPDTGTCDYNTPNACGNNPGQWCYQNSCGPCSKGFFNCNNVKGCECDSAGCNGTKCAGKCSGGECP